MEGRKIQRVGYSTSVISLPTKWIKQAGLEKGDMVFCSYEKDGSLKLMPTDMSRPHEDRHVSIDMDLCSEHKLLERLIVGCYIVGYDTITICSQSRIHGEWLSAIRNATHILIGLSIIDEKPNTVTLQCSIDPSNTPITTMIRRLFALTETMYTEVLTGLSNFDLTLVREVINREDEADKLYWLILRVISIAQTEAKIAEKIGVPHPLCLIGYRMIIKSLEDIGDYLEDVANHLIVLTQLNKKPDKIMKDLHQVGETALKVYSNAFESFVTDDLKKANEALAEKEKFEDEGEKNISRILKETRDLETAAHIRCMIRDFQKISDYGASIAHVAINLYVIKPGKIVKPVSAENYSI